MCAELDTEGKFQPVLHLPGDLVVRHANIIRRNSKFYLVGLTSELVLNLLGPPGMLIGVTVKLSLDIAESESEYLASMSSPLISFHTTSPCPPEVETTIPLSVQHVQHVTVEYSRRSNDSMNGHTDDTIAEPCDSGWMALADLISHFPRVHSVRFAFASEEDKETFVAKNNDSLQRLQEFTATELVHLPTSDMQPNDWQYYPSTSSARSLYTSAR